MTYLFKDVLDIEVDCCYFLLLVKLVDSSECLFLNGRIPRVNEIKYGYTTKL